MENNELLTMIIELVVTIIAFFVGRYILPKHKISLQNTAVQFEVLLKYAESFCAYARKFLTNYSGSEKMNDVVEKLKVICEQHKIELDDDTLKAIAQKAYDAMVAGEKSAGVIIEAAVEKDKNIPKVETVLLSTTSAVEINETTNSK